MTTKLIELIGGPQDGARLNVECDTAAVCYDRFITDDEELWTYVYHVDGDRAQYLHLIKRGIDDGHNPDRDEDLECEPDSSV